MYARGRLNRHLRLLLREVVATRCPDVLESFDELGPLALARDERLRVAEALTAEFCATGLLPDFEPNERGRRLEDLIDFIWVEPLKRAYLEERRRDE